MPERSFKERLVERLRVYRGERFSRVEDYPDFTAGARAALELEAEWCEAQADCEFQKDNYYSGCGLIHAADELRTRAKELSDG